MRTSAGNPNAAEGGCVFACVFVYLFARGRGWCWVKADHVIWGGVVANTRRLPPLWKPKHTGSKGLLNANRPFSTHITCCLLVPSSGVASHDRVEEADLVSELPLTYSREGLCPATTLVGNVRVGTKDKKRNIQSLVWLKSSIFVTLYNAYEAYERKKGKNEGWYST